MSIARPDRAFFLIAVACALAYVSLPRDTAYYDRWFQLFPVAAVSATLVGVRINRPRSRLPGTSSRSAGSALSPPTPSTRSSSNRSATGLFPSTSTTSR